MRNPAKNKKFYFVPFLVAGDPNFKKSLEIAVKLCKKADILEIGFPYSDPLVDGKVISLAHQRSLADGNETLKTFQFILKLNQNCNVPIYALVYCNLVFSFGIARFYKKLKQSGVKGIIIPDLPVEESSEFLKQSKKNKINQVFLVTTDTHSSRLKKIINVSKGFIYVASDKGTTGVRKKLDLKIIKFVHRLRKLTQKKIFIGFGISDRKKVSTIRKSGADGVIIGSAIINFIYKNHKQKGFIRDFQKYITYLMK